MAEQRRGVSPDAIKSAESDREKDVDILAVHRQAFRETGDPVEGTENGPWWFWACAVFALVFGGFYLGRFTGVFAGESAVHAPYSPTQMMQAAQRGGAAAPVNGQTIFAGTCAACHQPSGQGSPGMFPPLAGSDYVTGDAGRMIRIVLKGLSGAVTVHGGQFNGQMPPWQQLSDAELAAVISYVRTSWGNSAGAVTAADVAGERAA
ncbi:MAG: c-type cytochrome, partial [Gemmatimonadales bacterium]